MDDRTIATSESLLARLNLGVDEYRQPGEGLGTKTADSASEECQECGHPHYRGGGRFSKCPVCAEGGGCPNDPKSSKTADLLDAYKHLQDLTSDDFSKGGDRPVRAELLKEVRRQQGACPNCMCQGPEGQDRNCQQAGDCECHDTRGYRPDRKTSAGEGKMLYGTCAECGHPIKTEKRGDKQYWWTHAYLVHDTHQPYPAPDSVKDLKPGGLASKNAEAFEKCERCGEVITDNGDGLWIHNWSKSNNCDPEDPEGDLATPRTAAFGIDLDRPDTGGGGTGRRWCATCKDYVSPGEPHPDPEAHAQDAADRKLDQMENSTT